MKIATFNINGIVRRLDHLLAWLEEDRPDIVCLQELKCQDKDFPAEALSKAGYEAIWKGEKSWNGVAILARGKKPIATRHALPGEDDKQARYIEGAVDGLLIASLYLPNGNPQPGPKFDYKLAWFERLNRHAKTLMAANVPVVLAGDFNVAPTELDIYPTRSHADNALLQPESRAAFQNLIDQGWTDTIRSLYQKQRVYTFWDYMRQAWQRDAGWRLDYLLLSRDLASRLDEAGVAREMRGRENTSDHAPVWLTLR